MNFVLDPPLGDDCTWRQQPGLLVGTERHTGVSEDPLPHWVVRQQPSGDPWLKLGAEALRFRLREAGLCDLPYPKGFGNAKIRIDLFVKNPVGPSSRVRQAVMRHDCQETPVASFEVLPQLIEVADELFRGLSPVTGEAK